MSIGSEPSARAAISANAARAARLKRPVEGEVIERAVYAACDFLAARFESRVVVVDPENPPDGRVLTRSELEELLQRHLAPLRSYVRLRSSPALRQMEPPSDVLQSALREIVVRAESFRFTNERAFRRWILTIALHKIVSKSRYHGAARRTSVRADEIASRLWEIPARDEGSHTGTPSRHAVHAEDLARLQAALDRLDDEDREIVCLRRIFDVPTSDIAEMVGLAESTVRWRLARAMTQLASELE